MDIRFTPVPEPASVLLPGAGALTYLGRNWGRKKTETEVKKKKSA